jgi:hypothetical protein
MRRALALSLCLHFLLFAAWRLPGWRLHDADTRIEARLLPPPAETRAKPIPKPKLKPQPRQTHTQVPAPQRPLLQGETASSVAMPNAPSDSATALGPAAPASTPLVDLRAMPGNGRISFDVNKGEQGFVIGRAVHEWTIDGDRYQIRSHMETVGIVALFADVQLDQTSNGHVDADGLHPDTFRDNRRDGQYQSDFDWTTNTLHLANGTVLPVTPGAQDLLSVFYQMALYPLDTPAFTVLVTTGRKLERYTFHVEANVPLVLRPTTSSTVDGGGETEDAPIMTWHLTYQDTDGERVEVWLARDDARLPVKIRYVDRHGGTLELVARNLNYSGKQQ